jgi:3-hydroxybutyryl-CoA dehydrogenase
MTLLQVLLAPMLRDAVALAEDDVARARDIDVAMRLGARHERGPLEYLESLDADAAERLLGRSRPELPGLQQDAPASAVASVDGTFGVVGSGFMAAGIAYAAAIAGLDVVLAARTSDAGAAAHARIVADLEQTVARGRLEEEAAQAALARVRIATDLTALAECEIVVEAVVEDLATKRDVFAAIERVAAPNALLASNTSSLLIADIASATSSPERVVGLHFFSPVRAMKLTEVIGTDAVPEDRVDELTGWARRLRKVPVRSVDRNGFIVNRLLIPMLNDAARAADAGVASVAEIDELMVSDAGHPIGPFALLDLIGLDVTLAAQRSIHAAGDDPRLEPAAGLVRLVEAGRLGRKSGAGYHDYTATAGTTR